MVFELQYICWPFRALLLHRRIVAHRLRRGQDSEGAVAELQRRLERGATGTFSLPCSSVAAQTDRESMQENADAMQNLTQRPTSSDPPRT